MKYNSKLLCTIGELGKDLSSINLLITPGRYTNDDGLMINSIIEGCPKLKTLTLESLLSLLVISKESLKALYNGCKELKDLKLTKVLFLNIFTEDDIKKILPDCNVEIKECHLEDEELSLYSSDSDNQESNAEGASEESDDSDDLPPLETC